MRRKRKIVEGTLSIHIREVRKALADPAVESILVHPSDGVSERVRLIWRDTPFGGRRAYFECPRCLKGAEILYSASFVACRRCHGLAYRVENMTPIWRKNEKLHKLQRRAGIDISRHPRPMPTKPKWQRWHTYLALRREIKEADHELAAAWMHSRHGSMLRLGRGS
jgi:hypothetical protein